MSQDTMKASTEMDGQLRDAIESGEIAAFISLLDNGANIYAKGDDGDSLLHIAAADGRTEVCKLLLDRGMSVDIRSDDGWTALMIAAYWGYQETFDFMLKRGADLHAVENKGKTAYGLSFNNMPPVLPLHIAKLGGSLTSSDLELRHTKPYDGLKAIEVAARGGLERDLLEMLKADIPWETSNGLEGLRELAEQAGSSECVAVIDAHRAAETLRELSMRRSHKP